MSRHLGEAELGLSGSPESVMANSTSSRSILMTARVIALVIVVVAGLALFLWFAPKTPVAVTSTIPTTTP